MFTPGRLMFRVGAQQEQGPKGVKPANQKREKASK